MARKDRVLSGQGGGRVLPVISCTAVVQRPALRFEAARTDSALAVMASGELQARWRHAACAVGGGVHPCVRCRHGRAVGRGRGTMCSAFSLTPPAHPLRTPHRPPHLAPLNRKNCKSSTAASPGRTLPLAPGPCAVSLSGQQKAAQSARRRNIPLPSLLRVSTAASLLCTLRRVSSSAWPSSPLGGLPHLAAAAAARH